MTENASSAPGAKVLDILAIKEAIPHRYPFLLIDKVTITEEDKKAVGLKCVTSNEPFFQGHFPARPIMPGVLIVEAMAQTACVLFLAHPERRGKLAYFMGLKEVKFRKPVVPGDVLELHVEILHLSDRSGKVRGEAFVNGQLVTEGEFTFILAPS